MAEPTSYQRVVTATDYDASAHFYYLAANGTNTWMQTNSIDLTATDKVTVFAGFTPNVSSTGILSELGPTLSVGGMTIHSGYLAGNVSIGLNAGAVSVYGHAMSVGAANLTTGRLDIAEALATNEIKMRLNGVARTLGSQSPFVGPAGNGNFGNYPLYLFRRGGTTLPLNGNFYGLLIRGALTSDPDTLKMEKWLSFKTGVQL